jgi:hypothetical protein
MILIENLFYLILLTIIVFLYFYIIKVIYLYIKQSVKLKNITLPKKEIFSILPKTTSTRILLLAFVVFNYSMHNANRIKWVNKHTVNHNAKEYFVSDLDIVFYKKILNIFFKQDSLAMKPFNELTAYLYKKGENLLPKDDGEKYYWRYRFFNYWYIRGGGYMPDYDPYHPKPITKQQQTILNDMYEVIKGLATLVIKDQKINKEKYKAFIATANYYVTYDYIQYNEYIHNRLSDADRVAFKDKNFIKKDKNILSWALRFKKEYEKDKDLREFIDRETPILGVSYYIVIESISEDLVIRMFVLHKFNCNSKYLKIYTDTLRKLVSDESPLYNMSKTQQDFVKNFTFDNDYYKIIAYTLNKQCNKKIKIFYPSEKWIKKELPSIRMRWLRGDNVSVDNKSISIDSNITDFKIY